MKTLKTLKNRTEPSLYYITETWMMLGKATGIGFLVTIPVASSCPWFIQLFIGWFFATILLICFGPLLRFFYDRFVSVIFSIATRKRSQG